MKKALGMIETRGLVALFEATDAMLKAANVTFAVNDVESNERLGFSLASNRHIKSNNNPSITD